LLKHQINIPPLDLAVMSDGNEYILTIFFLLDDYDFGDFAAAVGFNALNFACGHPIPRDK
jgi:hypothetical protein